MTICDHQTSLAKFFKLAVLCTRQPTNSLPRPFHKYGGETIFSALPPTLPSLELLHRGVV